MSLIEWRPEFSVGNVAVDHEHGEMIKLINDLYATMQQPGTQDLILDGLSEIYVQISAHFALEEKIMRDARYADYEPHKKDHEQLLDQLLDIMDGVEEDGSYDEKRLSASLEHWFSAHFRTHDAKLHRKL